MKLGVEVRRIGHLLRVCCAVIGRLNVSPTVSLCHEVFLTSTFLCVNDTARVIHLVAKKELFLRLVIIYLSYCKYHQAPR